VLLEPGLPLGGGVLQGLLVAGAELALQLVVDRGPNRVQVVVQRVLGIDPLLDDLVLALSLLSLPDHAVDLLLGQPPVIICDGDMVFLAAALFDGLHGQDRVLVDLESDLDLGLTPGRGGDAGEVEFAQQMVVFDHGPLSLED
jgi:hypothetical protein